MLFTFNDRERWFKPVGASYLDHEGALYVLTISKSRLKEISEFRFLDKLFQRSLRNIFVKIAYS